MFSRTIADDVIRQRGLVGDEARAMQMFFAKFARRSVEMASMIDEANAALATLRRSREAI